MKDYGTLSTIGNFYLITISELYPLDEQVKTVFHELAHIGLEGENFDEIYPNFCRNRLFGKLSEEQIKNMKKLEAKIDKLVNDFYNTNPLLVNKIRTKLSTDEIFVKI